MRKIWIKKKNSRVIMIEDQDCYAVYLDQSDKDNTIIPIVVIPRSLGLGKTFFIAAFELATIELQDYYDHVIPYLA